MVYLAERRAHTISPNTAGGFLVPDNVTKRFWEIVLDEQLLQFITIYDQEDGTSNSIIIENDQTFGVWGAETVTISPLDAAFASVGTTTLHKLTAASTASIEFLDDALVIDPERNGRQILDVVLANRLRRTILQAIANGTGTTMPTGLFAAAANLASQVIGAVTTANISTLFASIHSSHLAAPNCAWVMSPTTWKTCIDLPLPNNWMSTAATGRFLLSYPVLFNAYVPAGQIVFGNLAYYAMKRIPQLFAGVDRTTLALTGRETRFAWTRADAKPVVSASSDVSLGILKPA